MQDSLSLGDAIALGGFMFFCLLVLIAFFYFANKQMRGM